MRNRDRIPSRGRNSRVLAKNVLPGDAFLLNGDRIGSVESVNVRRSQSGTFANIVVQTPNGKTFRRRVDAYNRVWIRETPAMRRERRRAARLGNDRPNYFGV